MSHQALGKICIVCWGCLLLLAGQALAASPLLQGFQGLGWYTHKSKVAHLARDGEARRMSDLFVPEVFIKTDDAHELLGLEVQEIYYYFDQEDNNELSASAGELGLVEVRFDKGDYKAMVQALRDELGEADEQTAYDALWVFSRLRVEVRSYGGSGYYFDEAPDVASSVGVVYIEPRKPGFNYGRKPLLHEK